MKNAFYDERLANCPKWYLIPPPDINMRIPDTVKNCVAFIGVENSKHQITFCGTGFFVSIKSSRVENWSFPYFVTARHVVAQLAGKDFYIRANTKDGKSIVFKLAADVEWWFHPNETESADVAVFPSTIPENVFKRLDYSSIQTGMFVTEEQRHLEGIGVGDEVFSVGLFAHLSGNGKNLPIIRMGNIAMIPDEQVPTSSFGNMEVYLIESRSIGGLSGSPVFVVKQTETMGRWRIHLLGLIHGHWDIDPEKIIDVATEDTKIKAGVNMGIAMVVPAKKILETINRKELADNRTMLEEKWIAQHSPTPD